MVGACGTENQTDAWDGGILGSGTPMGFHLPTGLLIFWTRVFSCPGC